MAAKRNYMTIGEVVQQLRVRYPDLSISKVRYLEEEQILKPARTPGGYRKFSQADVDRLELALKLQKDKYLPINVIRHTLNLMQKGQMPMEIESMDQEVNVISAAADTSPVSAEKAMAQSGLSLEDIKELESYGILEPERSGDGKIYSPTDVQLMVIAKEMQRFGIQPRHLRLYANSAEREVTLFKQILMPMFKHKGDDNQRRTTEVMVQLTELSEQLKNLILRRSLSASFK